ncbi:metallophosphoesterase [Desulfotalea psychrophila]|nr:metallophosphoesterase [Desulfotalea psychrophila]
MIDPLRKILTPLKETQNIRGVELPIGLEFLQLVVTGPPGAGKSYYIDQIGGWPNEGYIDLTHKGWWKGQSLTYRPREVHLGIPFKGYKEAITVFDREWLDAPTPPRLDLSRIKLPPAQDGLFVTNWNDRYIFEFLIPDAATVYAQRTGRQDEGYFPVDDDLTLSMVEEQLLVYQEVAHYLHRAGMHVYVRKGLNSPPMIIVEKGSGTVPFWSVEKKVERPSLRTLAGWRYLLLHHRPINWLHISHENKLLTKSGRIAHDGRGFKLLLGKQSLYFQPEIPLGISKKELTKNWTFSSSLHCSAPNSPAFLRLCVGETAILGRLNQALTDIVQLDKSVAGRHVSVSNIKGDLVLTPLDNTATTSIRRLNDLDHREKLESNRYASFIALRKLMEGPIQELDTERALSDLQQINKILAGESSRPINKNGEPGGILDLTEDANAIIVGDLHGQVDNFLKILTENCIIHNLRKRRSTLIILGDAIHSEIAGEMEDMTSSVLLMDIILRLKLAYPKNVHYIRGNHDSFDATISKNGISQGLLHKEHLLKIRGLEYVNAMNAFWQQIPYIVRSPIFSACHAGPPLTECPKMILLM